MKRFPLLLLLGLWSLYAYSQSPKVTVSGLVKGKESKTGLAFVNVVLQAEKDSAFVGGTVTGEDGRFSLPDLRPGNYLLRISFLGYNPRTVPFLVGRLSEFLDLGTIELDDNIHSLGEVLVTGNQQVMSEGLDKKIFNIDANISQTGGSVLQAMQNLPGVTINQEGQVQLRGSSRVTVLIDGKQTALTGFGNQAGLDNIPASAIEGIEIINNPSARFDANGMAGIINIILKKNKETGLNGKVGLTTGLGALGEKRENLPTIRDQYSFTPKINPTASLNYRQEKVNLFFQGDLLSQSRLNKNEFIERTYADGTVIKQQYLENRTQTAFTVNTGFDWFANDRNSFTLSGLYSREGHIDRGDLPFFNAQLSERRRLWQFHEDEVNTSINASAILRHKFPEPGHGLEASVHYTFHREDEKFFFTNTLPATIGSDTSMLIADENVTDFNVDYVRPLKAGRIEAGTKFRWRYIPTRMTFIPGQRSILDVGAGGWANYDELISALYGNYVFESKYLEVEAGLRMEYVNLAYEVTPAHPTYRSDGYNYLQPFPSIRLAYLLNKDSRISLFYNRRVDRPDEQDLRVFPKYDDPEILKTGNPALRPQFTETFELASKTNWKNGYVYASLYNRNINNIITRIITGVPGGVFLNSIAQNAGSGLNRGLEVVLEQEVTRWFRFNVNLNGYQNTIRAFAIENLYPFAVNFAAEQQRNITGNAKVNGIFQFPRKLDLQLTGIYLAPDIIPQGTIASRYSVDFGLKQGLQKGKGEVFLNGSDLFNTMRIKREITGTDFRIVSTDLYETQVFRVGYTYKF